MSKNKAILERFTEITGLTLEEDERQKKELRRKYHKQKEEKIKKVERIYIAGAYLPKDCTLHDTSRVAQQNTNRAIEVANILIEQGHFVFVPHLSHYIHTHYSCERDYNDWWYEEDMTFLDHWATAIYMLDGWKNSKGAKMELQRAKELGLKILHEL